MRDADSFYIHEIRPCEFGFLCYSIPHFIYLFLLYKLFFSSGISKNEGCSPNGMSSKLIICMAGRLTKKSKSNPMCICWLRSSYSHSEEGKGRLSYRGPLQALGPDLSLGFHDNRENPWWFQIPTGVWGRQPLPELRFVIL